MPRRREWEFHFFLFFFLHLIICGLTVPAQRGSLGWLGEKELCLVTESIVFLSNSYDF